MKVKGQGEPSDHNTNMMPGKGKESLTPSDYGIGHSIGQGIGQPSENP